VADFEDLGLADQSFWNGADQAGGFTSGEAFFANLYNTEFQSWDGWSYSNLTDTTTPGMDNQYSAIAGGGHDGSATYAVGPDGTGYGAEPPTIDFAAAGGEILIDGLFATNTTWTALSMEKGDDFARKFGGDTGGDPDWFLLTITGLDGDGETTGVVEFYLADFRFDNSDEDYIISQWTWVDLTSLGQVAALILVLSSSDTGEWGMNTPGYFAVDSIRRIVER